MQSPNKTILYNQVDKKILKDKLQNDPTQRITLSFYKYVFLENPHALRDQLYHQCLEYGVLGRIYLSHEGINAQISLPKSNLQFLKNTLLQFPFFASLCLKHAVEDNGKSFYKLTIKARSKIVDDGKASPLSQKELQKLHRLNQNSYLNANDFNTMLNQNNTLVIDVRNHYEYEVGHFHNALHFDTDTFREVLPLALKTLSPHKSKNILLYCTGGIRCEKISFHLKQQDFPNVYQLHGGIIHYAHQVKQQSLSMKFKGKNFVFDERLGESISGHVISCCHQCHRPSDQHVNCKNDDCHLLFIQCPNCAQKMLGCCSYECMEISRLPLEIQKQKRRSKALTRSNNLQVYKSRLRPKLHYAFPIAF